MRRTEGGANRKPPGDPRFADALAGAPGLPAANKQLRLIGPPTYAPVRRGRATNETTLLESRFCASQNPYPS